MVKQSIAEITRETIENDLSIQDALSRRYGNVSAIARLIRPRIQETFNREIKLESIITSIKRAKTDYGEYPRDILKILARSTLNVRTDVTKLSLERTSRTLGVVRRLLANYQQEFLQVSESLSALTLIFDSRIADDIRSHFQGENILEEELNLGAIIVQSPPEIIRTPGCVLTFYSQLSRRHINIEDTTSCYTDTILVVKMNQVSKAFTALADLISNSRTVTRKRRRPESG